MSVAGLAPTTAVDSATAAHARGLTPRDPAAGIAALGVMLLLVVSPFEALSPLLRLPGQSVSTVETALVVACGAFVLVCAGARQWPQLRWPDLLPAVALVAAAGIAAVRAPLFQTNAVHMAARLAMAVAVSVIAAAGTARAPERHRVMCVALAAGTMVSVLVIADFAGVPLVERGLRWFRSGVAVVGAQVRASGPFQYPTIASMYLEVVFALGLGLLAASAGGPAKPGRTAIVVALACVAEAIILTFTRAGLITMALAVALVGGAHYRRHGADRVLLSIGVLTLVVTAELLSSRPAEMLVLRMTSEGQGRWFSAVIDTPSTVAVETTTLTRVPLTVTNTGRATWDSHAGEPILLSYHWIDADSDVVVQWEGERTAFDAPVRPGDSVRVLAAVRGPGRPGHFRLMWDLEQVRRLWFSTEPDASPTFAEGVVTGPTLPPQAMRGSQRIPRTEVRPGRLVLWRAALRMWRAHPLSGVGADNFRLLYGRYAGLVRADPRVHSNNMYIEVLAGMGLLGAAALVWLGTTLMRGAWTALGSASLGGGLAAAVAALAVHGLVDSFLSFTGTYVLFAVTIGMLSAHTQEEWRHAHRL